jgi:hypothetical protein
MAKDISSAIVNLSAAECKIRMAAASEIYLAGRGPAERAVQPWMADTELSGLLLGPQPNVTVGVAVRRETFARIRAANESPELARVPPEQDAEEFELHFAGGAQLDVLTSREPDGPGAIARFLQKFGEGVQQVEFQCRDIRRATEILRERFGVGAIYSEARTGAGGTRINFFLVPISEAEGAGKVLIELYEM